MFFLCQSALAQRVIMGVYENYPLVYTDGVDQPQGIFVDIARYAAKREYLDLEFRVGTLDQCYQWLEAGEIDVIAEHPDYKNRDSKYEELSSGVISSWARVYAKEGTDYTSLIDLNNKNVAVLSKSQYINSPYKGLYHSLDERDVNCNIYLAHSYQDIFRLLNEKKVDAGVIDRVYGDINEGSYDVIQTPISFAPSRLTFLFHKADSPNPLVPIIEEHLRVLKADKNSLYYTNIRKYFEKDRTVNIPFWAYIVMGVLVLGVIQLIIYVKVLRSTVANRTLDLRNAYADIKARQQTLSLIYNNASELIALFEVHEDGNITLAKLPDWYLQQLYEANIDYPPYKILGISIRELYKDLLKLEQAEIKERTDRLESVIRNKQNVVYEENFKSPRGNWGVAESNLVPILDKDKHCTHILYVSRNITHQKKMVEDLTETKNRLQMAIEGAREGMWDWDITTNEVVFNEYHASMLGFTPTMLKGNFTEFSQRIHPEDRDKTFYALMSHLNNESDFYETEHRLKTYNDGWKWIMVHGKVMTRDSEGKPLRVIGTNVDIHDRKMAELALKKNQRRLATLMSNLPGMVYRCQNDEKWSMIFTSEGALELTGYDSSDFISGKLSFVSLIVDKYKKEVWKTVQKAISKKEPFTLEYEITTKCGEKKWVWEQGREVEDGILEGFVSDISERMNAREKIISTIIETEDKERKRIAKELHDSLGQKLTTVSLNFNSLKKDLQLSDSGEKKLNTGLNYLKEAIKDSREIAHNLMPQSIEDFGYVLSVQSLMADIDRVSETKFEFYDNLKGARLPKNLELHLYRVTQEAINNILKYAKASQASVQLMAYNDEVVLTIEDDGIGFLYHEKMEDETQSFGLRSMKNRVNSLSGNIEVETSPENGTVIIVEVPFKYEYNETN
ncbi:PAS domain-containing protein [Fulvivirga maritima]|uniref:PAS domain-containing protein n=1 Tax=Fulvivirga maritima TaxID=2904247 RepID=UPI001F2EC18B|nr:PAS domain-containing protein [Fulvivirga maritima]UII25145.1 PAS domain-containing protein [Fulvivirga maritima]